MSHDAKQTVTNAILTAMLAGIAVASLIGSGVLVFSPPSFITELNDEQLKALRTELAMRVITDFVDVSDNEVRYAYLGEALPEKLADDEIVERRTNNSYTRGLGVSSEGKPTFNTIAYARPAFTKEGDIWYYLEYAYAPHDLFYDEYAKQSPLSLLFGRVAHAVTLYAGAGDGYLSNVNSTWAGARDATSATITSSTDNTAQTGVGFTSSKSSTYSVIRAFLPFVTSSIPASAVITGASLNVYVTSKQDDDNDGIDYMTVVQTSQATHTTLVAADFDNIGTTEGISSGQRKDITSVSTSAYLSFTLNSTGIGWIAQNGTSSNCSATAGITCLGIREGHDNTNASTVGAGTWVVFYTSEQGGTATDPYLSVIYTDFSFGQFFEF